MLKCNLKDLYVVSDEVARYAGFFSQFDLYVEILSEYSDIGRANQQLETMSTLLFAGRKNNSDTIAEHIIKTGDWKSIYKGCKAFSQNVLDNYESVKEEYPDFNDFILSIAKAKSPDISRFLLSGNIEN